MTQIATISPGRSYDELPKRNRVFIDQYVLTGDAEKAYLAAGYKASRHSKAKAQQLKSNLRSQIAQKARELSESVDMAILGMKVIRDLAQNAESENVRLAAAKELKTQAMPDAPKEVTVNHNHTIRDMTEEEIDRRIRRLTGELAIDVTPEQSTEAG